MGLNLLLRLGNGAKRTGSLWMSSSIQTVVACTMIMVFAGCGKGQRTPFTRSSSLATCQQLVAWTLTTLVLRLVAVLMSVPATHLLIRARIARLWVLFPRKQT